MTIEARIQGAEALNALSRDLRGVADRREIVKALRKELLKPVPRVREAIRDAARRMLPSRNGLGAWVAKARITASARVSTSNSAGITMKAGRNSRGARSDLRAIDRGRVRAPSWGRRGRGEWHNQIVMSGFMTDTVTRDYADEWQNAALAAVDKVVMDLGRK